jgi:hypothetical protein
MAVTFVAASTPQTSGSAAASTVAIAVTLPTGTAANTDRVFIYQDHNCASGSAPAPTGWFTLYKDAVVGTGAPGAGTGQRFLSCYYRDYDGVWTMPTISLVSVANNTQALVAVTLRKAATENWDTPTFSAIGTDSTSGTGFSAAIGSAFQTTTGALLVAHSVVDTLVTVSAPAITGTGFTSGTVTERADAGSSTGNDVSIQVHTCSPTAGASAVLTLAMTLSAASIGGVRFVQQTTAAVPAVPFSEENVTRLNMAVPAGVAGAWVTLLGGGAGAGVGFFSGAADRGGAGGGGGGAYVGRVWIPRSFLGANYTVTQGPVATAGQAGSAATFVSGSVSLSAGGGSPGGDGTGTTAGAGGAGGTATVSGLGATTDSGGAGSAGGLPAGGSATSAADWLTGGGPGGGGSGGWSGGASIGVSGNGGSSATATGGAGRATNGGVGGAGGNAAAGNAGGGGGGGNNASGSFNGQNGGAGGSYGAGGGGASPSNNAAVVGVGGSGGPGYNLVEWVKAVPPNHVLTSSVPMIRATTY